MVVLDAAALLAWLQDEPGSAIVDEVLAESGMSSVNWAEVVQKTLTAGVVVEGLADEFGALGMRIEPFSRAHAEAAARLHADTRAMGLSLADRACLALALVSGSPIVTADRAWLALDIGIPMRLARPA